MKIDVIAFDADDTLWINEPRFQEAGKKLRQVLAPYASEDAVSEYLHQVEIRNLGVYGYGVKGFLVSMLEAAVEISHEQVKGHEIAEILRVGRQMLEEPIRLFDHVEETLDILSKQRKLMIITKGDLVEQEARIARSGLAKYFDYVEIVSEKTEDTYRQILEKYTILPWRFMMIGNSLRSDILPVVALGSQAIYIHYEGTWAYENVLPEGLRTDAFEQLDHIGLVPEYIKKLENADAS
jgi:putative hydrolase of the HAD superfamily